MFSALSKRQPGSPWYRVVWWTTCATTLYVWMMLCFRLRMWGQANLPSRGPVLLVGNHQSYMDPMLLPSACHRRHFFSMARDTLWDTGWLGWLLSSVNSMPVSRGVGDTKAMRGFIEKLNQGQSLLVYPEGTRTDDGEVKEFSPGLMLLIKRARPVVVPVAVEGPYDAWSRHRKRPKLFGRVAVSLGEPIHPDDLIPLGAEGALALLQERVTEQVMTIRERFDRWD
ncbi:lysophospholipid acyltransferase family protein [Mucisphaera calidilacus]|uniref:1-acyl-sn-glycerol-3-phosphate acyltransferase n=1 Tax=Mucisphaera calidilacus TaxID=2527982 RepID=A0A518BWP9_9BACT|nr:lysophospholipid acyltransferase family protein [Mucisphaera calidilacus]QDU71354.1 1-acyl-sn-glycerol-3-phosphate acyltransferase [Mucisphaera calidilacus]